MFLRLLTIETRKLFKNPILWVELGILALIFVAYFTVRYVIIAEAVRNGLMNTRGLELDLQVGLGLFGNFSVLFYAATAAIISAYDYPDRSIQMWLTRGVPRALLLLARVVMILVVCLLLTIYIIGMILALAMLMRAAFLGGFTAQNLNWMQLILAVLRIFAASIPYLALTVLLGVISRSPLFAAGGTLVFVTVVEKLLEGWSDNYPALIQFIPSHLAQLLQFNTYALDRTARPMILVGAYLNEPQAFLSIGILLLVFSALSLVIFSRQDLGG
jgi:ABC-type transport system involved in multi-copper enzyme maturation permease subunit